MPLPHAVARLNKRYTNRWIEPLVRRRPGFAVVHHRGRRSGRAYATPLRLFPLADGAHVVVLTYGDRADWLKNVLVGGGAVEDDSGRRPIVNAALVQRDAVVAQLPLLVRFATRVLRIDLLLRLER